MVGLGTGSVNADIDDGLERLPEEALGEAVKRALSGEPVLFMVESEDGTASSLVDLIPDDLPLSSRVACAAVCQAAVGGVADDLDIEGFSGGAMVLEQAQWADPTSLGRLQRLLKDPGAAPLLLIIAFRPTDRLDTWWLERLATASSQHAQLFRTHLETAPSTAAAPELSGPGVDLVVAASLVTGAIPVPVAADLLAVDETEVMEIADDLVQSGWLLESRSGYMIHPASVDPAVGEARVGFVADRLATALEQVHGPDSIVAALRLAAGHAAEAFPLLASAAREAELQQATGEAFRLAEAALDAVAQAGLSEPRATGELHLICARFLRSAGRTDWARQHLEQATRLLDGTARIDALTLAATVADDSQHPQEAEWITAIAEWEAIQQGDHPRLGSLLTLRARSLHRIGLAEEADFALAKGEAILSDDSEPERRFQSTENRAWIHFDRGEARRAESEFTHLRDQAMRLQGQVSVADKEAWRARALFASGNPGAALEAIRFVEDVATREGVEAPVFLSQLALTEGSLSYGRYEDALSAGEHVLDLVERQLPAWENMARSHRASALFRLGRLDEARAEIAHALDVSPSGADGWRWRLRCRALKLEIEAAAGARWPADEAEDLADLMLQSQFYGWAAELLCAIAENGKRREAASEAMAIAVEIGLPMVAARAAQAGRLWDDRSSSPVVRFIRSIDREIPPGWGERWRQLPAVQAALAAPEPTDEIDMAPASQAMEESLRRAGLVGETVLSPAQRRSRGLVRRSRVLRPLQLIAAGMGVVVLAAGTALGVSQLTREDVTFTASTLPEVATTIPLAVEETQIPVPGNIDFFFGTAEHRGDPGRSGVVEADGPRQVGGYYWKVETAGAIEAPPVAFGKELFVGSTEGTFYVLDQTTGDEIFTMTPEGRIAAAPALGRADMGQGGSPIMLVVVDDEGVVRGRQAQRDVAATWSTQLDGRIRSSPLIVDGVVFVATTEGLVHGLDLVTGAELWRYPEGDTEMGAVSADLTFHQGVLYVGDQEGILHMLDVTGETPELVCTFDADAPIVTNPMVVDDIVYVPTQGHNIWTLPPGRCDGSAPNRLLFYATDTPVEVAPAIQHHIMYLPDGRYLYAKNLATNQDHWTPGSVGAESPISAAPVIAGGTVYFGSQDGLVHAVDATSGELLWTWQTGLHVRATPAVVDGVVFIVSGDGFIYAVGGG